MTKEKKDTSKKEKKISKDEVIKNLVKQIEELKNEHLRTRADFENFKKRKEKESLEIRDRAVTDFVLDLLPAIDNFEMSLKMTDNQAMFVKGVEMIHKNLTDTLKEHKFEEFEPKINDNFDPYMHDPILIENDDAKPGKVIGILKKGYKRKENIVRPARVQVKKEQELVEEKTK
ncbi:MAG: nucleotide exchange factor GrpE [Candidatus Woesearchaeota archaeon]|jgi:molecular chaperone GrpE|nr:nucleotide exchange factor GrpE [Candidatus Woesearchaeota archaeon]